MPTVPSAAALNRSGISISCYDLNSCTDLNITAGDEYLQLHMYKYSAGINLYNGFGYSLDADSATNVSISLSVDELKSKAMYELFRSQVTLSASNEYPNPLYRLIPAEYLYICSWRYSSP